MQKSLVVVAAALACSGAWAQSSVTMFGVVDAGIGKTSGGKVQMQSAGLLNHASSRWGIRGVEDLGGGLKAGFIFESQVNLEDGSTQPNTFARNNYVWLGGTWGTFKMGRTLNPSYMGLVVWNIHRNANYSLGDLTYNQVGQGPRNNSQFSYQTPNLSGFSSEIGYIFKADNNGNQKIDANLTYASGPLAAGLSFNKTKSQKSNFSLGAKYKFGLFTLMAGYTDVKDNGAAHGHRRGAILGGLVESGAFRVSLTATRDTRNTTAGGVQLKKYTNGQLELNYDMSKRTFAYTVLYRRDGVNNVGVGLRHSF